MSSLMWQIVSVVINVTSILLMLRFACQVVNLSSAHPFVASTYNATRITDIMGASLPKVANGRFNLAAIILLFVLQTLYVYAKSISTQDFNHDPIQMLMFVTIEVADWFLGFYYWTLIALFVLSWATLVSQQAVYYYQIVSELVSPIMAPLDRVIPSIGPFNISLIIAVLLLSTLRKVLAHSGAQWALG